MEGWLIWGLFVGFWWGEWFADCRAERRARERRDPGVVLLAQMYSDIVDKRRFVGRECSIERIERVEIAGEPYTLSLKAEGDLASKAAA